MLKEGLAVHLETRVTEIRDKGREIVLSDGSVLSADMLIFAVGVSPKNEVVKQPAYNYQIQVRSLLMTSYKPICRTSMRLAILSKRLV